MRIDHKHGRTREHVLANNHVMMKVMIKGVNATMSILIV